MTRDGDGLVSMPGPRGQCRHDAGRTLAQVVLALANGATSLSDLAALRAQPDVFGAVVSVATVWRTFQHFGLVDLRGMPVAMSKSAADRTCPTNKEG